MDRTGIHHICRMVSTASTAVDRVALYFIPIQLVVFSRLPYLARKQVAPVVMKVMIVLGYTAVLFVWLNFATHSKYWIPYQNLFLQGYILMCGIVGFTSKNRDDAVVQKMLACARVSWS